MRNIFELSDLDDLRQYLSGIPDKDILRETLYDLFLKHSKYRDAKEWNRAVRICEALAITGWGEHEPLEAIKGCWFNGNPETYFRNRDGKPRFMDAVWSKRKDGYAIDFNLSFCHGSALSPLSPPFRLSGGIGETIETTLCGQRNWIPKNPIHIVRGLANCYENSKQLINSLENDLIPELNKNMRPESYGCDIDLIILNLSFSFYDNYHCKTNHIIADETWKLKKKDFYPKLLEMYSENEIEDNGYYLRNRFSFGPFRKDTGKIRVEIVFEKEFSEQTTAQQKLLLSQYLNQALETVASRLQNKIGYNFPLMLSDFKTILTAWVNT